jgi:hypothetical protein
MLSPLLKNNIQAALSSIVIRSLRANPLRADPELASLYSLRFIVSRTGT